LPRTRNAEQITHTVPVPHLWVDRERRDGTVV